MTMMNDIITIIITRLYSNNLNSHMHIQNSRCSSFDAWQWVAEGRRCRLIGQAKAVRGRRIRRTAVYCVLSTLTVVSMTCFECDTRVSGRAGGSVGPRLAAQTGDGAVDEAWSRHREEVLEGSTGRWW
jgi:hypothetical protein